MKKLVEDSSEVDQSIEIEMSRSLLSKEIDTGEKLIEDKDAPSKL